MVDAISTFSSDQRGDRATPRFRTALHAFAGALGFGQRGLVKAGSKIGLKDNQVHARAGERISITDAERLAMTAALFDLPPFDESMTEVDDRCRLAFDLARAELDRCRARASGHD